MADVDIVSGSPIRKLEELKKVRQAERDRDLVDDYLILRESINTEGGNAVISLLKHRLMGRIEVLVGHDPEASAILAILNEIGVKLDLGREAIKRLNIISIEKTIE